MCKMITITITIAIGIAITIAPKFYVLKVVIAL